MRSKPCWLFCLLASFVLDEHQVQAQEPGITYTCDVSVHVTSLPFVAESTLTTDTPTVGPLLSSSCDSWRYGSSDHGVAYTVTGTGNLLEILVDLDGLDDGALALYTGNCAGTDDLICGRTDGLMFTYLTQVFLEGLAGIDYTIVVASSFGRMSTSPYSISIREHEKPANDRCEDAEAVSSLPFSSVGNTTGAFSDFDVQTCAVRTDDRGVWYKFVGTGKSTRVQVTTEEDDDTVIAVFKGSCDDLFCDGSTSNGWHSNVAVIDFTSFEGVEYYIYFAYNQGRDMGPFSINITDFESPSNDECSNAVLIDSVPAVIQGDTTGALSGASYTKGYSTYSVARAVWYKFIGHGKIIQLSLRDADFDVRLVVYKGGNCTSFELADNLLLEEKDTKATWAGDDGVEYIVMVGGETIGDIGPFNLNIEEFERPLNDDCSSAEFIESLPHFGNYDTKGAFIDTLADPFGVDGSRGIWFTWIGGGGTIQIELSSTEFEFGILYLMFRGSSCGNLEFVKRYWSGGMISYDALAGEQYFFLVTGDNGFRAVGKFGLEITGDQVLPQVDAPTSTTATLSPTTLSPLTNGASPDGEPSTTTPTAGEAGTTTAGDSAGTVQPTTPSTVNTDNEGSSKGGPDGGSSTAAPTMAEADTTSSGGGHLCTGTFAVKGKDNPCDGQQFTESECRAREGCRWGDDPSPARDAGETTGDEGSCQGTYRFGFLRIPCERKGFSESECTGKKGCKWVGGPN